MNLAETDDLPALMAAAAAIRDRSQPELITYSPKVFIPLTQLCRDVCHYCTFAKVPRDGRPAYMSPDEVLKVARQGARAGCREALFTLGEKPETRYRAAREALDALGFATTIDYLHHVAALVLKETGLLPHLNPGTLQEDEMALLRPVSASMGLMLESTSKRLCARGGPHFGSPDKDPQRRLETLRLAGEAGVPFTTGILIGIGETRRERIESLLAIRESHERYGHIQEVIVQNFLPKPDTRMAAHPPADRDDHLWTIAVARLILGADIHLQAPPNLSPEHGAELIRAGIDDWGGVSPVTADFVNPEAPWPQIETLAALSASEGKTLVPRLAAYPDYVDAPSRWFAPAVATAVLRLRDGQGYARDSEWYPGLDMPVPQVRKGSPATVPDDIAGILSDAEAGASLSEAEIERLFSARDAAFHLVCETADRMRQEANGERVHYVVTRNINYTNVCTYGCRFCAFSKGKTYEDLRGKPYDLDMAEFGRRVAEAWERGATEVCLQGGIHPDYTGETYLTILRTAKAAAPGIHVHAFSPLEVWQGARTLKLSLADYLGALKDEGLASLPGTAAEILDDEVRNQLCPDKITTGEWFAVMEAAHSLGLKSTATIMYGHIERPVHWARHLVRLCEHQRRFGGFTEFVPLPFVAHEAPIFMKGLSRRGPTWREAVLMHAVGRIALHPFIAHVQTSWVKMAPAGTRACLNAGADDMGGTLMNESITRAAGATHGQEFSPQQMNALIREAGRIPGQRTTLYGDVADERIEASFAAPELLEMVNTPLRRRERSFRV
ncbi:5-amino-6-(D-ribitylamino)uracil--L-tyrosine 4-hydroxyphenyl transferase CofH [Methyloligella sp. 2.7D]|nr:5-amino-6-(D-ribitylamino)uracil--L-tyrosine 4-hydroxyphenyl transferase CofH [Methyloligella sp. GL2]